LVTKKQTGTLVKYVIVRRDRGQEDIVVAEKTESKLQNPGLVELDGEHYELLSYRDVEDGDKKYVEAAVSPQRKGFNLS